MDNAEFLKKLTLTTLLVVIGLFLMIGFVPEMKPFQLFSWISCLLFVLLSLLIYWVAYPAARHENKNKFTNVILGAVMGKLVLSMAIILTYFYWIQPDSRLFIAPFFLVYIGFTIFEIHFLMRLGKVN
jgi:cation transport ATPase